MTSPCRLKRIVELRLKILRRTAAHSWQVQLLQYVLFLMWLPSPHTYEQSDRIKVHTFYKWYCSTIIRYCMPGKMHLFGGA
jgi:hypothetical protein